MMTWTHYWLSFRLVTPLHVGYRKVGNLMQTRPYVPGKVLWGGLTARITRDHHDGTDGNAYRRIGMLIQEHFRFGYLWPSLDREKPYFPWEHDDFDYLFLSSAMSTALQPTEQSAEEGSLHQAEFIASNTREGNPVYLLGDLWVNEAEASTIGDWKAALGRVQLGGERGYGWGRVRLETKFTDGQRKEGTTLGEHSWAEQGGDIVLALQGGKRIEAHALATERGAVAELSGSLEPLVGWERKNDLQSQKIWDLSSAIVCWAPGSYVERQTQVRIGENGIWEIL